MEYSEKNERSPEELSGNFNPWSLFLHSILYKNQSPIPYPDCEGEVNNDAKKKFLHR